MIKHLAAAAFTALSLLTVANNADAFTTGGHFTATDRGLKRAGFDPTGIRHVQAANYMVDHLVNLPSEILNAEGEAQRLANIARFYHMDGLYLAGYIEREFAFIDRGLQKAVADGKARRDPRVILNAIGIASHAIQDFYSHANFADIDWESWKGTRVVTMDDIPRDIWESPFITGKWSESTDIKRLLSGMPGAGGPYGGPNPGEGGIYPSHGSANKECAASEGGKDCGANHDGARRRNNLNAIVMAAEATFDLAERARLLVNDTALWNQVKSPGSNDGVNRAWDRAQSMSMAAGQWGWELPGPNYIQLAIAFASTGGVSGWDIAWGATLKSMWLAAPTAQASGGGAPLFPPNGTPLFGLPQPKLPTTATAAPYVGTYSVLWGTKKGSLVLGAEGSNPLVAILTIETKTFKQPTVWIRPDQGLNIAVRGPDNALLSGTIYVTGPTRNLAGFIRDGQGVPDGFVATKSRFDVLPINPNQVKSQ